MELRYPYKSEKIEKKLNKGTHMIDIDNRIDRRFDNNRSVSVIRACYTIIKIVRESCVSEWSPHESQWTVEISVKVLDPWQLNSSTWH
jgi:hypothetical protein